jgi:predicted DNA-binding WGR domain protein
MIETIKSINLACTTGGHDKVYNLWVNRIAGEAGIALKYEVVAEYGKRLGVLKKIIKGNYPNAHQAVTAFDDLVDEKKKKGYVEPLKNDIKYKVSITSSKPLTPLYILPKKEEYKVTFRQDKPTITIPQDEYLKLLAGTVPVAVPVTVVNGRKFRDE